MNTRSSQFLSALALLRIVMVRFSITRKGRGHCDTPPHVAYAERPKSLRPFHAFSVTAFFDAFALPPLQGTYTLYVAEERLCYDPPAPNLALSPRTIAAGDIGDHRTRRFRPGKVGAGVPTGAVRSIHSPGCNTQVRVRR